jgi:hypothetical protein
VHKKRVPICRIAMLVLHLVVVVGVLPLKNVFLELLTDQRVRYVWVLHGNMENALPVEVLPTVELVTPGMQIVFGATQMEDHAKTLDLLHVLIQKIALVIFTQLAVNALVTPHVNGAVELARASLIHQNLCVFLDLLTIILLDVLAMSTKIVLLAEALSVVNGVKMQYVQKLVLDPSLLLAIFGVDKQQLHAQIALQ